MLIIGGMLVSWVLNSFLPHDIHRTFPSFE